MTLLKQIATFTVAAGFTASPALAEHSNHDQRSWFSPSVFGVQIDDEKREDAGTTGIGGQLAFGTALSKSFATQVRVWDSVTNRVDDDQNRSRGVGLDLIYRKPITSTLSVHGLLGAGIQRTDVPAISGLNDYTAQNEIFDAGFGITRKLTPHGTSSLFEIRHRLEDFDRPTPGSDQVSEWLVNIGMVIPFGKAPSPISAAKAPAAMINKPEIAAVRAPALQPAAKAPPPEPVYEPVAFEPVEAPVVAKEIAVAPTPAPIVAPSNSPSAFFQPSAEPIYFEIDSAILSQSGEKVVKRLASEMIQQSVILVQLTGFANDSGNLNYNTELAKRRVEAIQAALVHRGVSSRRIRKGSNVSSISEGDSELNSGRRVEVEFQ
jgi:outer membrane protein OmpA-like peptidoglycan-associated protein